MTKLIQTFIALVALVAFAIPVQGQSFPPGMANARRAAFHITSATTTTVVSQTAYIKSIVITAFSGTPTVTIQNKEGTAKKITAVTAAAGASVFAPGDVILSTGGIDIVTSATGADVFITYYLP